MTYPARLRRAGKAGESRADIPMPQGISTRRFLESCDQLAPWLYLDNYKASYF
jgi:hypothetical protein